MEQPNMIFLDTHVVVWLYARLYDKLSLTAEQLINEKDLYVSPIVKLELQYLYEIERITERPGLIIETLEEELGLRLRNADFMDLVDHCLRHSWTRDPFDRMMVAHAEMENAMILTKDQTIHRHFTEAKW